MAALRNKQVSGTKNVIGLYMAGTGTSTVGINTLSNMGLSATYQTVYNNKKQIQQKLLILNIDDYHDLHESRIPTLNFQYMTGFSNSYNAQKFNWISIKDVTTLNEFDLVETLVVHCYDADLSEKHVRRFDTTKLVDFILSDLKNMNDYIKQQKLLILNIDDYHDLHESRIPSVTSINRISHMATILLNTNNILPIPLSSTFHNPNGIDANLLKQVLNFQYMTGFSNSYNAQKFNWISIKDVTTLNEFDLVETLVVHCYDADLSEKHVRRFDTTKLVDFILSDLKNMNDYIKVLIKVFRLSEMQSYLMNYIIPIPADFPGQLYIRRAIVQKLKYGNQCSIPKEVLSLVPILGPLHVSLNTRESCFLTFHPFFNELYKEVFGKKKFSSKTKTLAYQPFTLFSTCRNNLRMFDEYPVENFYSLVRRHTSGKVTCGEWLRRDAMFIDYHRNDNQFAQSFTPKRSYPYTKKNLDLMAKRTAIFLLQFFEKLWINCGKAERKMEGARIKKPYYYFPPLSKRFSFGAIPLGYHSSHLPNQNQFCDYENCDFIFNTNGIVLICGHAYHEECFDRIGLKCQ
ncbi:hypothetical protein Glove_121g14 [Diversispora epigaea]|uniref:Uncharacterized protein n=1 Tax=Diversispora epigaea TaxID=1348612 RepID=A0A397J9B8_9GLOM|nr:hypothetical protein Glove_121g14 [Diversispora epigaea]